MNADPIPLHKPRPMRRPVMGDSALRTDSVPRRVGEPTQATAHDEASATRAREAAIDASLDMTFPASDPPAWTL